LVSSVTFPTRITKKLLTLIDITITNKNFCGCSSRVMDLSYSDHLAQMLNINADRPKRGPVKIRKRQLTKENIDEFNYLLKKNHGRRVFKLQI
jgi:hypothetical protein